MVGDRNKKRIQGGGDSRRRHQIALEAARRMFASIGPGDESGFLREATEGEYYTPKRKAAAVLGHRVRPGDLPSDSEVREQVIALARSRGGPNLDDAPEPEADEAIGRLADHIDRFTIYRMRLMPLEAVKQAAKPHPEGDVLYHSLQVFELAREVRPYDEEFLLAALLHDVGKAIDPRDPVSAGIEALRGTLTERSVWLIRHQLDPLAIRNRPPDQRALQDLEDSDYLDDLILLRDLDEAGRVPGAPVGSIEEALDYLKGLENEEYLNDETDQPTSER